VQRRRDRLQAALGLRLRQLREERDWTQEVFAEKADIDRSYVAGIEAGLRNPSFKLLAKMAAGLGMTVSDFLKTVR
jgi:transcriptional regulator with XRE-family HTH domain